MIIPFVVGECFLTYLSLGACPYIIRTINPGGIALQKQPDSTPTIAAVAALLEQKRLNTLERTLIGMLKQVWELQGKRRKIVRVEDK